MLDKNSYDTICHEHIEYYSLKSLKYLFDKIGFKIIEVDKNNVNFVRLEYDFKATQKKIYDIEDLDNFEADRLSEGR